MVQKKKSMIPEVLFCLSYFDHIDGPRMIATLPDYAGKTKIFTSEFFDFHENGDFFTHIFKTQITFNKLFKIKCNNMRGGSRQFMLSLVIASDLLKKRDLLTIYKSLHQMFETWIYDIKSIKAMDAHIKDGKTINKMKITPLLNKMNDFLKDINSKITNFPQMSISNA